MSEIYMILWITDWGYFELPEKFHSLKFRKDGWYDGRRKASYYEELRTFVDSETAKLREEWLSNKSWED